VKFEELNDTIPYVIGGKVKVLRYSPYPHIVLAMPGRHAKDTTPKGGDFVVMVSDPVFDLTVDHQFTHDDIFRDVELRAKNGDKHLSLLGCYFDIVQGADPAEFNQVVVTPGVMAPSTFLTAVQCLAVAEHRRYSQYESKYGGRFLPFRFAAGIDEGLWDAEAAIAVQRKGRPGVEWLEKQFGVPALSKELMS
jgi:hypothetical protein